MGTTLVAPLAAVELDASPKLRLLPWMEVHLLGGGLALPSSHVGLGRVYLRTTFFPECVCLTPFSDFSGRISYLMSDLCQIESVLKYYVRPLVSGPQG